MSIESHLNLFDFLIRWVYLISVFKILIIALSLCTITYANYPISLKKFRSVITTEFKGYDISDTESIQLYGAKHRKFITNHWYWGEAGYGALFGKRSGYLEGGIFTGIMSNGPFDSIIDYRIFTGAGGGGSAPQGGGFIVHPTIGIGKSISSALFIVAELGYMHFINGDISSMSIGISINMNMWKIKERIQP